MRTSNELQQDISRILERFDFKKVNAYMTLTNWTWRGEETPPTVDELKITATTLLFRATDAYTEQNGKVQNMGTGGFYVYVFDYGVKLTFEPFNATAY